MTQKQHIQPHDKMQKIDKRVERNTKSMFALRDLLRGVLQSPANFNGDEPLLKALKSQGAISKYANERLGIHISSINTLKRICEKYLDGGFDTLDRLRVAALQAMENKHQKMNRSNKITRTGMNQRIAELEIENQILQQELLLISYLLEKSMRQSRHYAEQAAHSNIRVICEKEQKEIRAYLSLSVSADILNGKIELLSNA